MGDEKPKAPGLRWRMRKTGLAVPYWVADDASRKAGYPVRAVNLSFLVNEPDALVTRCQRLQLEMRTWFDRARSRIPAFDGTFGTLIDRYLLDKESGFNTRLKPNSQHPYEIYAAKLKGHIGERRLDHCDGRDVQKWFKTWAGVTDLRDPAARIPKARMVLTVLKSAVSFGVVCRLPGCPAFNTILGELEFPGNRPRTLAPTAADIEAARKAAHTAGAPERAFAYALQFETTLRQWDVIGVWVPISDLRPSAVIHGAEKWLGPTWAQIDENLILRLTHEKTARTSGATGTFDLALCPMVQQEMALIPTETRSGPLIIHRASGLPYHYNAFKDAWKSDFKAAGLDPKLWNRDFRAGGITEGGMSGASIEDRRKVAGHTTARPTAQVYDRDTLEAHRRVAHSRNSFRPKHEPET